MDTLTRIRRLGGAARFSEIGTSRYQLQRLVATGALVLVERGCYALPDAPAAVRLAAQQNGAVSCVSALRHYGVDIAGDSSLVHVSVPRGRGTARRRPTGVRRHHEDVATGSTARIVPFAVAAVRAALCLPYDDAVAALDRVAHGRPASFLRQVIEDVAAVSGTRAQALELDVDGRSRSRIETLARLALRRAGLAVVPGAVVPGVGEVDLLVEGWIIVELDGYAFHSDRRAFRRDRARDRNAARLGFLVLRFAFEDSDPAAVVAAVSEIVRAHGDGGAREPGGTVPPNIRAAVVELRADAVGAGTRVQGWRHLRGRDLQAVRTSVAALAESG
ncbi:DUF559 domain-containing protein [Litorihabitans aurantiacus]|uniref:DUF559 domain-containing protein n=1 Tax=Litorihabitans aurantiacus TaxID=1930061 RepID=A0AA38CR28_9MICO|nr:DUF559 domain-containing protein [Litorihabitans aurantiacus]GMA32723.1 hypothetical protein GCM10025875_27150 [Litorihabitans aurantiacus]